MSLRDLPLLRDFSQIGPRDPVFDLFLMIGPVLIVSIGILGRRVVTLTLAAFYVALFVLYIAYRGYGPKP